VIILAAPCTTLLCCAAAAEEKVAILTPSLMREYVLKGEDDWVVSNIAVLPAARNCSTTTPTSPIAAAPQAAAAVQAASSVLSYIPGAGC
jgi:hypothetical protein